MIKGLLKADGLALMEITLVSFLSGAANPLMQARVAFIKSDTGATLGSTQHSNWSHDTLQALANLRDCMERDVAKVYMVGDTTTGGGSTFAPPQGIADHLGSGDAPSI